MTLQKHKIISQIYFATKNYKNYNKFRNTYIYVIRIIELFLKFKVKFIIRKIKVLIQKIIKF